MLLGIVLGGLGLGCASHENVSRTPKLYLAWPEPPAPPRVTYVQSIQGPMDVGARRGAAKRIFQWVAGADRSQDLSRPLGLALDENDNLCLTDTASASVSFFDHTTKRWQSWTKIGKTPLLLPVAVAKRGKTLFVADSGLKKVLAFDLQGKFLFALDQPMERPSGLAISGDQLYVADAAAHKILRFDLRGTFLSAFGGRGSGPGEFNYPTHLACDRQGRLYVTDSLNFRVQIFDAQNRYVNSISSVGDSTGHLSRPKGVAVDGDGNIYVIDALFDNVQIFDAQGAFLLPVGRSGTGPGEFWLPGGMAISQDNLIYVADSYNHRIQVMQYLRQP
jgi:DNA-binding beta-propeller fold protein YncE